MVFDRTRYNEYISAYNRQDWEQLGNDFYAEDIKLETEGLCLRGREVTRFLTDLHRRVHETLHPERVLFDGNHAAVELWVEFTALVEVSNFFLGPLKQGEGSRSSWCAMYDFQGDKIARLALYHWPDGSKPKLCAWPPPSNGDRE